MIQWSVGDWEVMTTGQWVQTLHIPNYQICNDNNKQQQKAGDRYGTRVFTERENEFLDKTKVPWRKDTRSLPFSSLSCSQWTAAV